jgi:hypothetical protein
MAGYAPKYRAVRPVRDLADIDRLAGFWSGQPTVGRVAIVIASVIATVVVALFFLGVAFNLLDVGHSESWQYGYDHSDSPAGISSTGFSPESACRSIAGMGTRFDSTLDYNDVMDGCLAGLKDRSG